MFCNIRMELNCSSSRLALIDAPGVLSLLDLEARIPEDEEKYKMAFDIVLFYFILYSIILLCIILFYLFYRVGWDINTVLCYIVQFSTLLYYTTLHCTMIRWHDVIRCNMIWYDNVQYSIDLMQLNYQRCRMKFIFLFLLTFWFSIFIFILFHTFCWFIHLLIFYLVPFRDPEDKSIIGTFYGRKLALERRDVWDIRWSEDDEELLCVMEKTKMVLTFICILWILWF